MTSRRHLVPLSEGRSASFLLGNAVSVVDPHSAYLHEMSGPPFSLLLAPKHALCVLADVALPREMTRICEQDSAGALYYSINGQEEMPIWAPPTPPTDENDIYIDYSVGFWYEPSFMHEATLPPIYIKKEAKRQKMDPVVSAVSTARKQKVRKDDMVNIPRSLFDRPSAAILKMRREVKLQKVKGLMVGPPKIPGPSAFPGGIKQPSLLLAGKSPAETHHVDKTEWLIPEDKAILSVIQDMQNIPLNLTILSPAHHPNWDLVAQQVYSALFRRYRSPKACKARYENVIVPREEGKILYDANPKKQKKTKGVYKTKNNRPMKTSQLFVQDNNQTYEKRTREFARLEAEHESKKRAAERMPMLQPPKTTKGSAVLVENGINFDNPLTPMQIAQNRSERIAREKQKNQPAAGTALASTLSTVTSPQVVTATVVSQVAPEPQPQPATVTVATGTIHPSQAAVLASLQAQQQLQLKQGQPSVSLAKSLTSGIMVSSSTASTLASLTKALGQNQQVTSSQNAAIAAALNNATLRSQRAAMTAAGVTAATTTLSMQDIMAVGQQVRAAPTTAAAAAASSAAGAVVSVSNLAAVQLATSQRLASATLSPLTTVASAQLNPQAATTQRSIAHMAQIQQMKQTALLRQRETALKQQLKRLHSVQQQQAGAAATSAAAKGGAQPRVAQQVTMKQAAVGRAMTEAEVAQLMKRQKQINLTASQILAQVQPQQVAISSSGATLVKTVSSPLAIPVSAVTMGGVNINVSVPQSKASMVQGKATTTLTNQQIRNFQLQQQLLNQARKGKMANLTQLAKVPGKAGGTSVQIVPQQMKNLQTAMTVAQIQQAMKQAIPQNMPVVVTATPSLGGVQQQPVGAVKATTLPSTTLTTSGVLKAATLAPQAVTLAVRAAPQGQPQQLQIQVQQSPHATLVSPQTQVVSTAQLTQARMQLQSQPMQTVTVQPQAQLVQAVDPQSQPQVAAVSAAPIAAATPTQLTVQQTNTQMVQQAIQLARQQQAAAQAAAQQAGKASPYTMRLRNPPK
ncbi:hypothetical protein JTE90_019446 [Oedothorax gibbosus]|uniref:Myb-like domain-containing protein n=1 Tax=Oedothorax gibbosus TaxID=931172 RepID=A0AAV6UUN2_9ARAC|nr:hypothetical protein JTE90_019446 [Oedothorax gibbosus]